MLEQDRIAATVLERRGGDWLGHILTGEAVLRLPEVDPELPLAALYEGIELGGIEELDQTR
jgi:hypothetical protein